MKEDAELQKEQDQLDTSMKSLRETGDGVMGGLGHLTFGSGKLPQKTTAWHLMATTTKIRDSGMQLAVLLRNALFVCKKT